MRKIQNTALFLVVVVSLLVAGADRAFALTASSGQVSSITSTSAKVTWTTDLPADSEVAYVPYDAPESETPKYITVAELVKSHSITVTGLTPATKYVIAASSMDENQDVGYIQDMVFTTLSATSGQSQSNTSTATTGQTTNTQNTTSQTTSNQTSGQGTSGTGLQYSDLLADQVTKGLQFSDLFSEQQFFDSAPKNNSAASTSESEVFKGKYPTGTLALEGGVVYFLMQKDGVKIPFTSWEAFIGLGYTSSQIQKSLDLSSYRTALSYKLSSGMQEHPWGSCLRAPDSFTVYYHHPSGMIGVPNMEVLSSLSCRVIMMNGADQQVARAGQPVLSVNDTRRL